MCIFIAQRVFSQTHVSRHLWQRCKKFDSMRWILIFRLSILGILMSIVTLYFSFAIVIVIAWIIIVTTSNIIIVKKISTRYFLNGFALGIILNILFLCAHELFYETRINTHGVIYQFNSLNNTFIRKPYEGTFYQHILFLIISPILFGLIFGTVTFVISKLNLKKSKSLL